MLQQHQEQRTKPADRSRTLPNNQHTSGVNTLTIIGQDESVFAQHLHGNRTWIEPAGQHQLLPKFEGDGYVLSVFVSSEFGFGKKLTKEELDQVNAARQAVGKNTYIDEQAVKEVLRTIKKSDLKESPLVK